MALVFMRQRVGVAVVNSCQLAGACAARCPSDSSAQGSLSRPQRRPNVFVAFLLQLPACVTHLTTPIPQHPALHDLPVRGMPNRCG
jgi:hypothetical protein